MAMLQRALRAVLATVVVLVSVSCDEHHNRTLLFNGGTGPTVFATVTGPPLAIVQPTVVQPVPFTGATCPSRLAFVAPFDLSFHGDSRSDLTLTRVHMGFVDTAGVAGDPFTLGAADLSRRFGSAVLLPAQGVRTFPITFPFGCTGLLAGTLTVTVFTTDALGFEHNSISVVAIR